MTTRRKQLLGTIITEGVGGGEGLLSLRVEREQPRTVVVGGHRLAAHQVPLLPLSFLSLSPYSPLSPLISLTSYLSHLSLISFSQGRSSNREPACTMMKMTWTIWGPSVLAVFGRGQERLGFSLCLDRPASSSSSLPEPCTVVVIDSSNSEFSFYNYF